MALAADRRQDQQIAAAANVSEGQLSRWKNGHVVPELPNVESLVRELGISGHWLLTGEGPMRLDSQADAVKLEVIGMVYNEEVDPTAMRRFAERIRGRDSDASQTQAELEGTVRGSGVPGPEPDPSDGPKSTDPPKDPPTDGRSGSQGNSRLVEP